MVAYSSLVGAAVGTLCALPGVPFFMTEICDQGQEGMAGAKGGRAGEQPDFQTLMRLQAGFEEMVEECHDFTVFAWDLRHSETAVRDLTSLVKPSRLACKDALLVNLEEYITVVSGAARQLSAYTGLVTGMTDRVIAADTFAIRHFEELATLKTAARASSSNAWPWTSFLESKRSELEIASAERRLLRIYQTTVNTTENAIRQLIVHGTIIMETLGSLENGLNKVEDTVQQERAVIGEAQEEVLAHVWTYLGGNKRQLQRMQSHQFLLENISGYRKRALTYLLKTLLHLQAMEGDLKHIAEVVGEPMLDGPDGSIPIAVQIATIRRGADRLAEGVKKTHNKRESYNQKILSAWDTFVKTS
ncbi:hypothetical protein BZA05DRAFT_382489 [Tricharina praecox]|uniref:uncharacterized protein n=1 Tax=Tricharina praecox TaxID=43433 RepID=UPI00221EDC1D|nr:uncharacterized protein BZA05DRAFT_382489 [Tricharina praecox]KAI5858806.1 hypothetical protein BZA05DRAFT_382489 [Tricharina praecox]